MNNKQIFLLGCLSLIGAQPLYASLFPDNFLTAEKATLSIEVKDSLGNTRARCGGSLLYCTISARATTCVPPQPPITNFITIANTSTTSRDAQGITVSSSDPNYNAHVIATNNCPSSLPPGQSCTISFATNQNSAFPPMTVTVQGTNTTSTSFTLNAIQCG